MGITNEIKCFYFYFLFKSALIKYKEKIGHKYKEWNSLTVGVYIISECIFSFFFHAINHPKINYKSLKITTINMHFSFLIKDKTYFFAYLNS